jgi:hypothetical protein
MTVRAMRRRVLRIALALLAVGAEGGTGFLLVQTERAVGAGQASLRALDRDAERVYAMVDDLRGAQPALVATGQDPALWAGKVAGLVDDATVVIGKVDRSALAPGTIQELTLADEALGAFGRTNRRVSDLLADGQPLTASAVIFTDAAQSLAGITAALRRACEHQRDAVDRTTGRGRLTEAYALGGAAGLTLVVLLLLVPRGRVPHGSDGESQAAATLGLSRAAAPPGDPDVFGPGGLDLDLRQLDVMPSVPVGLDPSRELETRVAALGQRETELPLTAHVGVDLEGAGRLCTDLACVRDVGELAALLSRAGDLMDAAGIVVWMGGVGASELRPAVSHGYSDHIMAKMKSLPVVGETAVAVAFRTGRLEVVPAAGGRNGAIVVPIRTAAGCLGAMAVEVRRGGEMSRGVQALSTIIAAQLSTLVSESS